MKRTSLYVILSLLGIILAFDHLNERQSSAAATNLADQWRGVELSPDLLDAYFNESCYGDEVGFAACMLAMDRIRERLASTDPLDKPKGTQGRFGEIRKTYNAIQAKTREPIDFSQQWLGLKELVRKHEDRSWIIAMGINGLLYLHRDPHTMIVPRSRYDQIINTSDRSLFGIGISVRPISEGFRVTRVLERSPADQAGIRAGDVLVAIDGISISGRTYKDVQKLLSDDKQTQLNVTVSSVSGEARTLDLTKKNVLYRNVESKVLSTNDGDLAIHLSIQRFSHGVCREVERKLVESLEAGATAMILDLRGNPGGPLREAACVADLLLPKDLKIFEARYFDKDKKSEIYTAQVLPTFTYPIITLVDAFTASAAELLGGALQDYSRSLIVGEQTYGKGSFQQGRVWHPFDEVVLLETLGLYYLPSGTSPQVVGLSPDFVLPTSDSDLIEREGDLFFQKVNRKIELPNKTTTELQMALLPCTLNFTDIGSMSDGGLVDNQVQKALRLSECLKTVGETKASFGLRSEGGVFGTKAGEL